MPLTSRFRSFLRNLSPRAWTRSEAALAEEVQTSLDQMVEENVGKGMTPHDALRAAKIEFGGEEQVKQRVRDVSAGAWLKTVVQDLRFSLRILKVNWGFTALVVLTLALGIGANTAIFSLVYGVLLRRLPYRNGGQIVVLHQQATQAHVNDIPFSVKEMGDYREYNHTLDSLVEYHSMAFLLLGKDSAQRVQTGVVSANFFDVLGVTPLLGRTFAASDESPNADAVLVLSYKYWKTRLGGDVNIVGKVFEMNNRPHRVIGVLPSIPQYPAENDVYMPTSQCPFRSSPATIANRTARMLTVFGRLKRDVQLRAARADLSTVAAQIAGAHPDDYPKGYGYTVAAAPLQDELTRRARSTLIVLLSAAGFVLLIACANVANLLFAQLLKREREFAIRAALGASKLRLARQLLSETLLLSLGGGAVGLLLAYPTLALLVKFAERFTTRAAEVRIDSTVLFATLATSIACGVIFGVVPALTGGEHLADALREGSGQTTASHRRQKLRSALVVTQIAVSFMLLIGAGLMIRSFVRLIHVDPGFSTDRILTLQLSPSFTKYRTVPQFTALQEEVLRRVRPLAGVQSVSLSTSFPFSPLAMTVGPSTVGFLIYGMPISKGDLEPLTDVTYVTADYFATIRQPILRGRAFTEHDDAKAPNVAIVNKTMVQHRWPTVDPIGKRISFDKGVTWATIVGVVGDAREYGLDRKVGDEVYTPTAQSGPGQYLIVRTAGDSLKIKAELLAALHDVDPQLAVDQIDTIERLQHESVASPRTTATLLGLFAALALAISTTGIAGIMALSVGQRTRELGIRLAIGQPKASVVAMILRSGLTLATIGTMVGLAGSFILGRLIASLLYETSPADALTFIAISATFVLVTAIACYIPARRVALIDPLTVLRQE
jgi:putative ABC transport system permease protein